MTVLVTGATGFLGGHLAERLIEQGHRVRALARPTSNTSHLESLDVDVVRGDVRDAGSLKGAVCGCTCVYHLAGATSQDNLAKSELYAINVEGTRKLAKAALEAGVERFVYASSSGVYGTIRTIPVDENSPVAPNSHYRRSKLIGEQVVRDLGRQHRLPVVTARISSAYGPRSGNWLGLFRAVAAGRLRIAGRGENHVQLGFASDIVEGIRLCGEVPHVEGRCYVIAGNEPIYLKTFVQMIADELGTRCVVSSLPSWPFLLADDVFQLAFRVAGLELPGAEVLDLHLGDRVFDLSRASTDLGYLPRTSLRDGLRRTLQWYRTNGLL